MNKIKSFFKSENGFKIVFIAIYLILNFYNLYIINSKLYIRGMYVMPQTFSSFLSCFFGDFGIIALFFGIALLIFKSDVRAGKFLIFATGFFSIFMFAISVYYSYYDAFPSIYNLRSFLGEGGGDAVVFLLDSILLLLKSAQYLFLLPVILMIIFWIAFIHPKIKGNPLIKGHQIIGESKRVLLSLIITLFSIILLQLSSSIYIRGSKEKGFEDLKIVAEGVQSMGIINYYLYEVSDYLFVKNKDVDEEKIDLVKKELESYLTSPSSKALDNKDYNGVFKGKNLLLIQIESMNNFVIGLKVNVNGQIKEITPNLNKLVNSKYSAYCNNYYTTVGIGNTSDAEFTVMTGIYPTGYSYTVYEYFDDSDYETLPKLFNKEGYYSYSSHANAGTFYMRNKLHPNVYGFNDHIDESDLKEAGVYQEDKLIHTWVGDVEFLEYNVSYMKEMMEKLNQPIFNFAITISCHMPYEMSFDEEKVDNVTTKNVFLEKDRIFPIDYSGIDEQFISYLEYVSYTDYAIGRAIDKMKKLNILDDTVIILYGDHGCGIDIYNMFYQTEGIFTNDINENITKKTYDQSLEERRMLLEVPLIIYDGSESVVFNEQPINLVRNHSCLSRTISNLFDLDNKYSFGVDILSSQKTYGFNPRNMDIVLDNYTISGISKEIYYNSDYNLNQLTINEISEIIDNVMKYKDFNDKILKYGIFKK